MKHTILLAILLAFVGAAPDSAAMILFGKDNTENQTDPSTGAPWGHIARVTDQAGTLVDSTAVYLGSRYMLTANHVTNRDYVTFDDGATTLAVEPGSHQQVASGVDMKVFRLENDPGLPELLLYEDALAGEDLNQASTLTTWGRGRDPAQSEPGDTTVPWGDNSTIAKRWGTNTTGPLPDNRTYTIGDVTYSYEALVTTLHSDVGADEAALLHFDSGGALFQQINGTWYLSGIATTVATQTQNASVFGTSSPAPPNGDENYFARVATYSDDINAIVPEPSTWALFVGMGAFATAAAVRRCRKGAGSGKL